MREADLGEADTAAANGIVTAEAKARVRTRLGDDAREAKARYFLGLAEEQDGKNDQAASIVALAARRRAADAPWARLRARGAGARFRQPAREVGPSAADVVAAVASMSEDARRDMVRGMVARLADRLHDNGADVEGWLRLVRAYVVLGDRDKAKGRRCRGQARPRRPARRAQRVDESVKTLDLEG